MIALENPVVPLLVLALTLAVVVGLGVLILIGRHLVDALERVGNELHALEAVADTHRQGVDSRLAHLDDSVRAHTSAVRDVAVAAPEAVQEQLDKVTADYERLAAAASVAVQYQPDPEAGTYQAGGADAIAHVKRLVQAAL